MLAQDLVAESVEVNWQLGATTVYGTLLQPPGSGPFPAVVMVAGSGPTDRDWNTPLLPGANGSARLLAEALARAGFASVRYDKRASGPHARENIQVLMGQNSMQSHLEELTGAVRTVASQNYIRADRIFALTNSEGALHALNYQVSSPTLPFVGLVLTAPPGRAVGALGRSQLAAQAAGLPNGDAVMAAYDAAIACFSGGEPVNLDPSLPEGIQLLLKSLSSPFNLPFARELWLADATIALKQVDVPVLIVIGKRDIQVDWQADGELLQRATAGSADVTFVFPEHANHVLKHEPRARSELIPTGIADSYNGPDTHLDPEAQAAILDWLAAHA
jgi:alpha-beta hydrolase superfamily lysophospholipase